MEIVKFVRDCLRETNKRILKFPAVDYQQESSSDIQAKSDDDNHQQSKSIIRKSFNIKRKYFGTKFEMCSIYTNK